MTEKKIDPAAIIAQLDAALLNDQEIHDRFLEGVDVIFHSDQQRKAARAWLKRCEEDRPFAQAARKIIGEAGEK